MSTIYCYILFNIKFFYIKNNNLKYFMKHFFIKKNFSIFFYISNNIYKVHNFEIIYFYHITKYQMILKIMKKMN